MLIRHRLALALTTLLLVLAATQPAHAVPLINGFGGPAGYGTNSLPANDDGYSSAISLTAAFPGGLRFFGGPYNEVWVNNNGNVSFSGGIFNFTPTAFPVASRPMIAPYWGDVDTRGARSATSNMVYWHLQPGLMVATWHNVGYYSIHDDKRMDFQLLIRNALDCGSGNFDVEFRYNRCEWTTGDASGGSGGLGGTPAQAGFDAGNGTDFVEIPGSRTAAILNLCTTSNVGEPGIWRFSVRGGAVACPGTGDLCDTGMPGACSIGVTQCVGSGIECAQVGTSNPERCDGVDNDCNGAVDDGELCTGLNVCWQGACVPPCFEGGCGEGETCSGEGVCLESACIGVECPSGQRCSGGACVGACEGIVCPHGQQCVAGRCTALCDVITCGEGEICVDGTCQPTCPCRACEADEVCQADGSCLQLGCDIVTCDPGFYCEAGTCLDACAGAVCPNGQRCQMGSCYDIPAAPDGGPPVLTDAGPVVGTDAGVGPGADGGNGGENDAGRVTGPPRRGAGCACRASGSETSPKWLLGLGVLGLALVWRRRR